MEEEKRGKRKSGGGEGEGPPTPIKQKQKPPPSPLQFAAEAGFPVGLDAIPARWNEVPSRTRRRARRQAARLSVEAAQ